MKKVTAIQVSTKTSNGVAEETLTIGNIFDKTNLTEGDFLFYILSTFIIIKHNKINLDKLNCSKELENVSNALDELFTSVSNGKLDD